MSLQPANKNFTIWQGATFFKHITYEIGGEVQDLTGFSATMPIKDTANGTVLLTLDSDTGGIVLGGGAGTIDLIIASSVTSALTWEQAVYELFITDLTPRTDVLLRGGIKVVVF